ncbi:Type II pantothenate kinase [Carpediemonas membranifera]|uniref:pantothenate kinase n=1 Tax=Carpediemonas membranifera TaxID=201153 RepID=A0A8J6B5F5_9EUKA|nr:Type II pantothenate kinase [Carpediemonas membranifera]|eukprot:KAG9394669.1 Type II pantothenate kinase [Carpediemonas membranifera]
MPSKLYELLTDMLVWLLPVQWLRNFIRFVLYGFRDPSRQSRGRMRSELPVPVSIRRPEPNKVKLALDIGGSLAKLVIFVPNDLRAKLFPFTYDEDSATYTPDFSACQRLGMADFREDPSIEADLTIENSEVLGGSLYFAQFETKSVSKCLLFITKYQLHRLTSESFVDSLDDIADSPLHATDLEASEHIDTLYKGTMGPICATGGGAFKFEADIMSTASCTLARCDEMRSLITGLNFVLRALPTESWIYLGTRYDREQPRRSMPVDDTLFPYLLVGIGSGVSLIRVDGADSYRRVDGTSLGGGLFVGLCRAMTQAKTFDEMLDLVSRGDNRNVDMLVKDIYGSGYGKIGLSPETIAASMGKATGDSSEEDLAKSALMLVCLNIAQIAYLNAERHGVRDIYFGGHFVNNNDVAMATISAGIEYWSTGQVFARFLRHEGFLGAIGSLVVPTEPARPRGMTRSLSQNFVKPFPPFLSGIDLLNTSADVSEDDDDSVSASVLGSLRSSVAKEWEHQEE